MEVSRYKSIIKILKSRYNMSKQNQINYKVIKTLVLRTKLLKSKPNTSKQNKSNYKNI